MAEDRVRLLVVEDSPEDREAYRRALSGRYELIETDSGEEALRLCAKHAPDGILLDYSLPDTDAIDFLRELKGDAMTFPLPVIVVTDQGNERIAVQAMKLGVEDYVVKGAIGELDKVIEDARARHALRKAQFYKVLIVDDNPQDREFYRRRLPEGQISQYEFKDAETCAEGLALCEAWGPDCVILDYVLPDADGLEYLMQLRAMDCREGVAVVLLTGQGNESVAVQALKLGAQDYVVKSRAIDVLRHAIHGAVEKVRLQRKIEEQRRELERSEKTLQELVKALREADRRKDEFMSMLAHELRNPLAPIRNAVDLLRLRDDDRQTLQLVKGVLGRQVGHLSRLVDDLLDVSRIARGRVSLKQEPLDLAQIARDAVSDHREAAVAAGLSITLHASSAPVWIRGDATRISQILANLLSNSIRFTRRGGRIEVLVSSDPARANAQVTVRDTGIGIATEMLRRVFDVFAQADVSLERKSGGLGLGLVIAKGLVQLHGGTIEAESEGADRGACFRVSLPLTSEAPALNNRPMPARPKPQSRKRILIVEDNHDAAQTLRLLLENQDYDVRLAYTGPDGLRLANEWRPDAVLCDIGLPDMDGYAFARELRASARTGAAKLIAITGYGKEEDRVLALESGFDDHVVKPADPDLLLDKLEQERSRTM